MSFFDELKRRNVFRVGIAYVVAAWVVAQVADLVLENIGAPVWVMQVLMFVMAIGFIAALIIAWAYEITPEGIKREQEVERDDSISHLTAKKLDIVTIGLLIAAIGFLITDRLLLQRIDANTASSAETAKAVESTAGDSGRETQSKEMPARVVADDKSIAVLPFANMANHPDNEPFTVGLHDDLLTTLSKIGALKVISRTSVLQYRDSDKPIRQIADELGVANVLEGGVQRSGNQIRLNVQLIDAETDEHLWAEKYDRELTAANIFQIQSEVSEKIAQALKAQLTPEETARIETAPTENLDAYNAYLAGRQRMLSRTSTDLEAALRLFQRATKLDPDYGLAYVAQADTWVLLYEYSDIDFDNMVAEVDMLYDKAAVLAAGTVELQTSIAHHLDNNKKQFREAEEAYKRALAINANYATTYHWYGNLLRELGRTEEALALHRTGAELDPLSPVIQLNVAKSLLAMGRVDEAKERYYRLREFAPDYPGAAAGLSELHWSIGELDRAVIWQRRVVKLDPGNVKEQFNLVWTYLDLGDTDAARQALELRRERIQDDMDDAIVSAWIAVFSNDTESALQFLQQSADRFPDRPLFNRLYGTLSIAAGEHNTGIERLRRVSPAENVYGFELHANVVDEAVALTWGLKQLGETVSAEKLLQDALAMVSDLPDIGFPAGKAFNRAELLAIAGDPKAAAAAFATAIDAGHRDRWWLLPHYPWLDETRQQPEFKAAWQRLRDDLAMQREHLANGTVEGVPE